MNTVVSKELRRQLIKDLSDLGCVEIESSPIGFTDPDDQGFVTKKEEQDITYNQNFNEINAALDLLLKYAKVTQGLFDLPREISEKEFNNSEQLEAALKIAREIIALSREINNSHSEEGRLVSRKMSLMPWLDYPLSLSFTGGKNFQVIMGVMPQANDLKALIGQLTAAIPAGAVLFSKSDNEQHYISYICHKEYYEQAQELLKVAGFSSSSFKEDNTVAELVVQIEKGMQELVQKREQAEAKIVEFKAAKDLLWHAYDFYSLEAAREGTAGYMVATGKTVFLQAWVPESAEAAAIKIMNAHGCAYEFFDPKEDEDVPVTYTQGAFSKAFSPVADLYGTPHYFSKIDLSFVFACFYLFFFAYMLSDAGYGILLIIIGLFMFKKLKPREGPIKSVLTMAVLFGFLTIVIGALFSSWFGDLPTVLGRALGGGESGDLGWAIKPLLFDPLENTLTFLGIALAFGVIHLFVGVGIGAWRMVISGDPMGGFMKSIPWYAAIIGFGLIAVLPESNIGMIIVVVALASLVLFSDRDKNKGIGARIGSGLWNTYSGITGWLGDILSYARLMALGLATGVVATVVNMVATFAADNFTGWNVVGWIIFIIVFIAGHTFNFLLGLLGSFIHTTRLKFVEFYTKCYVSGGRAFLPLNNQTKFVYVIKEEN